MKPTPQTERGATWLCSFVEESPGVGSSQRVAFLAVTALTLFVILMLSVSLVLGVVRDVPPGLVSLMALVQGVATAGKVWQTANESPPAPPPQ